MKIEPDSEIKIKDDDSLESKLVLQNNSSDKSYLFYISANYKEDIFLNITKGILEPDESKEIVATFKLEYDMKKIPSLKIVFFEDDSIEESYFYSFIVKLLNKQNFKEVKEILNYSKDLIMDSIISVNSNQQILNKFSETGFLIKCKNESFEVLKLKIGR